MAKKILIGLALFFTITASVIAILSIGYNEVIPGEIYRFRQLSGEGFSDKIDRLGIHTLVNLRGEHPHEKWYQDEVQAAKNKSVPLFSFPMSAKKLPSRKTLQGLIDVIMHAKRPLLVHCQGGNERSGMAAAIALLLTPGKTLDEAYDQVSLKYFNFTDESVGRQFLNEYREWLASKGMTHTPARLLQWVDHDYAGYWRDFLYSIDTINDVKVSKFIGENSDYRVPISRTKNTHLIISGWAIDEQNTSPADSVELFLDDTPLGASKYGLRRVDVANHWNEPRYTDSGWLLERKLPGLSPGCYGLKIRISRARGSSWTSPPQAQICID